MGKKLKPPPVVKPVDDGQTLQSRGIERLCGNAIIGFVRDSMSLPHVWKLSPAPIMPGYTEGHRGTPNHRGGLRLWRWAWALVNGPQAELEKAEHYLAEWYELQFSETGEGQWYAETLNTSHVPIWMTVVAGSLALAREYNRERIYVLAGRWMRRMMFAHDLLRRGDHVFSPGARSSGSTNELRTVIDATLRGVPAPSRLLGGGRPIPGQPNDPNGDFWKNVYNWPAWCLRELIARSDDIGGVTGGLREEIILKDRLDTYSIDDDNWLFVFEHCTKGAKPFMWWTACIRGELRDSPLSSGNVASMDNPFPPPKIIGAKWVPIPGVYDK